MAETSKNFQDFTQKLKENDAEFTPALSNNIYRVINVLTKKSLLETTSSSTSQIQDETPSISDSTSNTIKDKLAENLPVLALPNSQNKPNEYPNKKTNLKETIDDTLDDLERLLESGENSRKYVNDDKNMVGLPENESFTTSILKYDEYYGDEPKKYSIYQGEVTRVQEYGCFVRMYAEKNNRHKYKEGLVHVSQIANGIFIKDAHSYIKSRDQVKVKVLDIMDGRYKLSIKEVDQKTGQDLNPENSSTLGKKSAKAQQDSKMNEIESELWTDDFTVDSKYSSGVGKRLKKFKKNTDVERFEMSQMRSGGVKSNPLAPQNDNKTYDQNFDSDELDISSDEDINVEVVDEAAPFLKAKGRTILNDLSPVRVVKNPEGSLIRAAQTQVELAKERREKKFEKQNSIKNQSNVQTDQANESDMGTKKWLDPANSKDNIDSATGLKKGGISKIYT